MLHNSTLQNLQVSLAASEIPLPKRFTTSLWIASSAAANVKRSYNMNHNKHYYCDM
jgi:hypothetical protein